MSDRRGRVAIGSAVAALFGAVTWIRLAQVGRLRDQGWLITYDELASRILEGRPPADHFGAVSSGYLWVVTLLRRLDLEVAAIRGLQVAALSLAALFCALAAKRLGGWTAAVAAALFVLGNRAALIVAGDLDPATLMLVLISAALFAWAERPLAAGVLLGAAAVTRPVGFVLLIALWLLRIRDRSGSAQETGEPEHERVEESRPGTPWRARPAVRLLFGFAMPVAALLVLNLIAAGRPALLRGGTAFYEGNNARAPIAGGATPRVVADVQASTRHPTPEPVYRAVAAETGGGTWYWPSRAAAFMRAHPLEAATRFGWKALLTIHHFDVHDVLTSNRKELEMARIPAVPFGALVALAAAAFALRRSRRELLPAAIMAVVLAGAMVVFVVNARDRNPLLAPMAILAAAGAAEILRLLRARSERALFAFGAVLIATAFLGIEGRPMRELQYKWWTAFGLERRLLEPVAPERLFDAALGMQEAGAWEASETALASIADYRPLRANRAVSSVAYHRARAALRLRVPPTQIRELLDRAAREAPGDPDVLALRAVLFDPEAAEELEALYDPFTRDFALALAWADSGRAAEASRLLGRLVRRLPEWERPHAARHALRTAGREEWLRKR